MMSPQEAESRVFSKASFSGGYHMAQVDAFLDELISDYAGLYKENAALKGKMKVLAEKLEEYRATEDAMRRTLLSAQKMADTMLQEAESQKSEAIAKAEAETRTRVDEIRRELKAEESRLAAAHNSTTAYIEKLKELYTHELEYIGGLADTIPNTASGQPAINPVKEIEDKVSELIIAAQAESDSAENEATPPAQASSDSRAVQKEEDRKVVPIKPTAAAELERDENSDTVVFDRLEFGKDYEFD